MLNGLGIFNRNLAFDARVLYVKDDTKKDNQDIKKALNSCAQQNKDDKFKLVEAHSYGNAVETMEKDLNFDLVVLGDNLTTFQLNKREMLLNNAKSNKIPAIMVSADCFFKSAAEKLGAIFMNKPIYYPNFINIAAKELYKNKGANND